MATFVMFGKYTGEAIEGIAAERTEQVREEIGKAGGEMKDGYALLGEHDLMIVTEFPGVSEAMQGSLALTKLTGIGFTTSPAVPIDTCWKALGSFHNWNTPLPTRCERSTTPATPSAYRRRSR